MPDLPDTSAIPQAQPGDRQAFAVDGPEEDPSSEVQAPAATGALGPGATPSSLVPVRFGTKIGTVPVEMYQRALHDGATPLTPEEWQDHQASVAAAKAERDAANQKQQVYGHLANQIDAAGASALASVPLIGAGILDGLSPDTKEYIRNVQEANPKSTIAGTIGGFGLQIGAGLLSGGATAAGEAGALTGAEAAGALTGAEAAGALTGAEAAGAVGARAALGEGLGAAAEAGAAASKAAEAPTMLRSLGEIVAAPQNAVSGIGKAVERGVAGLLPQEAKSLGARLATKAVTNAAQWGTEGALYAGSDYLGEQALSNDPQFDAEKLLHTMGMGVVLGAAGGGLAGGLGELGSEAVGRLASGLEDKAGWLQSKSIMRGRVSGASREFNKVGGFAEVGKAALDNGVGGVGDTVEDTFEKSKAWLERATADLVNFRAGVDAPHPKIADVLGAFQEVISDLKSKPEIQESVIKRVEELYGKWTEKLGVDMEGISKEIPAVDDAARKAIEQDVSQKFYKKFGDPNAILEPEAQAAREAAFKATTESEVAKAERLREMAVSKAQRAAVAKALEARAALVKRGLPDKTMSYADLAALRQSLDAEPGVNHKHSKLDLQYDPQKSVAFKALRGKVEDIIEKNLDVADEAAKSAGKDADLLDTYKDKKLNYRRALVYTRYAEKAAQAQQQNATFGMSALLAGVAGSHLAAGPLGVMSAMASAGAAKLVKERGMSTAAVLADKVANMSAMRRLAERYDDKMADAIEKVVRPTKSSGAYKKAEPTHGLPTYEDKVAAVKAAAENMPAHRSAISRMAMGLAQHAPETAAAFEQAAIKATTYLIEKMPKERPANPMQPNGRKLEPSSQEKFVYGRVFDAVHGGPPAVLGNVAAGTVIPPEVKALQAMSGKGYDKSLPYIMKEMEKDTKPLGYKSLVPLSIYIQGPTAPTMQQQDLAMLQAAHAAAKAEGHPGPQSPGQGKAPKGGKGGPSTHESQRAIPKADGMSFAKMTSLTPSSLK